MEQALERLLQALVARRFTLDVKNSFMGFPVEELKVRLREDFGIYSPMVLSSFEDDVVAPISQSASVDQWFSSMAKKFYSPRLGGHDFNSYWDNELEFRESLETPLLTKASQEASVSSNRAVVDVHAKLASYLRVEEKFEMVANLWSSLRHASRIKLLRVVCPTMPTSVAVPYAVIDGKRENVTGITILCPELNHQYLCKRFLPLLKEWTEHDFTSLANGAVDFHRSTLETKMRYPGIVNPRKYLFIWSFPPPDGKTYGDCVEIARLPDKEADARAVAKMDEFKRQGVVVDEKEFFFVQQRMWHIVSTLALIVDEIRAASRRNPTTRYKIFSAAYSPPNARGEDCCKVCGLTAGIRSCSICKLVHYCSPSCQKADWKEHKAACKQFASAAPGAPVAAGK